MPTIFRSSALLLTAAFIACAPATVSSPRPSGGLTGAPTARDAVEQFLAAVRAQDIQAMSAVWGTSRGSTRDTMDRSELERRAIIMQCFLAHNQFRLISETAGDQGRRVFRVELTRREATRQTTFTTIPGPGGRWYVENVDLNAVRDFCDGMTVPSTR